MKTPHSTLLSLLFLAAATMLSPCAEAQNATQTAQLKKELKLCPQRTGGVYYAYPAPSTVRQTPPPAGYKPVYISHFGRHGSRWLPEDSRYEAVLSEFADTLNLTNLGRDVRRRLLLIYDDARGRGGDLTPLGAEQHRGIARRMLLNYPEVFTDSAKVEARSSTVGRCIMSMNSFLVSMAQARPDLSITAEANRRYMGYIAYTSPEVKELEKSMEGRYPIDPSRLMSTLFIDTSRVGDPAKLASELHTIASDMQNVDIDISLYDIFTDDEMYSIYEMNNTRMELCNGVNLRNNGAPQRSAASLWRNIVESADRALTVGSPCATLRFGHDTSLYRLFTRLGLYAGERRMDVIIPMAANLQMVFYRNSAGHVLVKFLHNERELTLPLNSSAAPYYDWNDVKRRYPTSD